MKTPSRELIKSLGALVAEHKRAIRDLKRRPDSVNQIALSWRRLYSAYDKAKPLVREYGSSAYEAIYGNGYKALSSNFLGPKSPIVKKRGSMSRNNMLTGKELSKSVAWVLKYYVSQILKRAIRDYKSGKAKGMR